MYISNIIGVHSLLSYNLYLIILKVVHSTVLAGYVSTNIFILFFGGLILFSVGIVGEYIGRIYMTVSNMPQYSIRSIIND